LLLLHMPNGVPSVNDVDAPVQIFAMPEMADGNGSTVKDVVMEHPVGKA
jgi:hypothetical protein